MANMFARLAVASLIAAGSLLTTASAFACESLVATETHGVGNSIDFETVGSGNYGSAFQDGDQNRTGGREQGRCNALVLGQTGIANDIAARLRGAGNGASVIQQTWGARAELDVTGEANGVFIDQRRAYSNVSVSAEGRDNQVVVQVR
jgi:hypothetical protein